MSDCCPREQLIQRLRAAGFHFSKRAKRVEIYRQPSTSQRVSVPTPTLLPLASVRIILRQAGLPPAEIERFLEESDVTDGYRH